MDFMVEEISCIVAGFFPGVEAGVAGTVEDGVGMAVDVS